MMRDVWRWLRPPVDAEEIDGEVDDELDFHLEMRARELIERGVEPERARAEAARRFGDIQETRRRYRAGRARRVRRSRRARRLDEIVQDVRFAARALRRRAGFTGMAVLVLALGIGASTTVLTLVDTIFFDRPAHVADPHRLVRVFRSWAPGEGGGSIGNADYVYYRDHATTLAGLAAYGGSSTASYRWATGEPGQLRVLHTSANYFDLLGVRLALGRAFAPEEDLRPGTHPVVVLSHGFWTRARGADPGVVGSTLTLNGIAFTVIGVAPAGFAGVSPVERTPDVWVPIAMRGALGRLDDMAWWERVPNYVSRWLDAVGRVADGVTIEAAVANLTALGETIEYRGKDPGEGLMVMRQFLYNPGQEASLRSLSSMLLAVVLIVLVISGANVTVLLLSRANTRHREIGIRTALGAGKGRLVRQLLVESLLLGGLGGSAGVALAWACSGLAASLLPLPFDASFRPDASVLGVAALLSVATALLVGLAPALHGARLDLRTIIQQEEAPARGSGVRGALVVTQVALSLVLVSGALLFTRSLQAARGVDLGFDPDGVLVVGTDLQSMGYGAADGRVLIREALERLRGLAGVTAVSTSTQIPFSGEWTSGMPAPGGGPDASDERISVSMQAVGAGYFEMARVAVLAGRGIGAEDREGTAPVTVVNEALAARLWPGEDAVGRTLDIGEGYTVVGVARNAAYYELGVTAPQAYLAAEQRYQSSVNFFVRTDGDAAALADEVQDALRRLDPDLAFTRVTTLDSVVEDELARYEVSAVLVGLFSAVALLLAATGLYGVVSFLVSRMTREIGVRMALGADRRRVARDVLRSGLRLAAIGVALGLVGTVGLRGLTEALLFGVEPADPLPLLGAGVVLLAVTALAIAGPARRATLVDPVEAIRSD